MKNFMSSKMARRIGAAGAAGLVMVQGAYAALPAAAATALTDIGTGVDDVEAGVWPVIGAVLVAFTIIKLVKRGVSKV